jgi:hypothetical protein
MQFGMVAVPVTGNRFNSRRGKPLRASIKERHLMSALKRSIDEMPSEKSCSTKYEQLHTRRCYYPQKCD